MRHPTHTAVAGLQFGDEGKGQIVDLLAGRHDLVVRYNGGANAGHTVEIGEERFKLHLLPSGVLCPETLNLIGNGVALDPDTLLSEIHGLADRGIDVTGNLRISDRTHLVLPHHRQEDRLREAVAARTLPPGRTTGATGRGIGPCYADKASRDTAVRVADLFRPDDLALRLDHVAAVKNAMLRALADLAGEPFEPIAPRALLDDCRGWGAKLGPLVADTTELIERATEASKRILFEGANAALLDVDHGTYPFVTSSNSSTLGIPAGAGVPPGAIDEVVGVVKAYTSRVGNGPMPTRIHGEVETRLREKGREFGTTTGRPRNVGWLDLVAVRRTARMNGVTSLALTGLGVLAGEPSVRICTGYRLGGRTLSGLPAHAEDLFEAEPIYEYLEGWPGPLGDCRSVDELPLQAKRFVARIEAEVARVSRVCVGRRREQALTHGAV